MRNIIVISDTHLGAPGALNSAELAELSSRIKERCIYNRPITLVLAGDIIDGECLKRGHQPYLGQDFIDQAQLAKGFIENLVIGLQEGATHRHSVTLIAVSGNHGNINLISDRTNLDMILYEMLDKSLFYEIIMPKRGFPFAVHDYLLVAHKVGARAKAAIEPVILKWLLENPRVKIVVLGHYHRMEYRRICGRDLIIGGTLLKEDPFGQSTYGYVGDRGVWVLVSNNGNIERAGIIG